MRSANTERYILIRWPPYLFRRYSGIVYTYFLCKNIGKQLFKELNMSERRNLNNIRMMKYKYPMDY